MRFVPSEELKDGTIVGRDIIFTAQKTAMLKKGTILTEKYIEYLQNKGYLGAYVKDELSADVEIDEVIDQRLFQEGVEAVMDVKIDDMLGIATNIVQDITSKQDICMDLIDLRSFDDYTYHHSVNVAVLSVIVGQKMGLSSDELTLICQAGLLHDLGKSKIPNDILNKPGKLTDEEFKTIQNHAQFSYDIISNSYDIPAQVRQAVLCHHENENGSGYPNGRRGEDLSIFSKIIHVVDVYDALTSKRPYKEPYEPINAFEYMRGGKDSQFNPEVVDALIDCIPPYPAGIDVYLSNGERALVVNHENNPVRPIVRLVSTLETIDLNTDPTYKDVKIEKSHLLSGHVQGEIHHLNQNRSAVKPVKKNVIVVDASKKTRMPTVDAIAPYHKVLEFESSIDAVNYVRKNGAPDLVIIDSDMPVLNGFSAIEKMVQAVGKRIPFIIYTANNSADTIMQARATGAVDYILKPAKHVYLTDRVNSILSKIYYV